MKLLYRTRISSIHYLPSTKMLRFIL